MDLPYQIRDSTRGLEVVADPKRTTKWLFGRFVKRTDEQQVLQLKLIEQSPAQCCNKDDAGEKFRAQGANECKHSMTVEIKININGRRGDLSGHQFS
jgi:hypothetical protein